MSYFDDQMDAWFDNGCKGAVEDYNPFDPDSDPKAYSQEQIAAGAGKSWVPTSASKWKSRGQKRNAQRRRAAARLRQEEAIGRMGR